jgi:hypothetical protein
MLSVHTFGYREASTGEKRLAVLLLATPELQPPLGLMCLMLSMHVT